MPPLSASAGGLPALLAGAATRLTGFLGSPGVFVPSLTTALASGAAATAALAAGGTTRSTYFTTSTVLFPLLNSTKPIVSPNISAMPTAIQAAGEVPLRFGTPAAASSSSVTTAAPVTPFAAPE